MIAYGYLRVSGKGQVDGDGPERQKEAIARFCAAHGLGEPVFFFEAAVSGTVDGMERPQFVSMIEAIKKMQQDVPKMPLCIVIERQDRLARDLIVQELILTECTKLPIPVYSTDRGDLVDIANVEGDPTRKVIRQIMGAMAEWEKSVTVKKLRMARDRVRLRTGRCEGPLPYGQKPGEKEVKEVMLRLSGEGHGMGFISVWLNHHGHKTRSGRRWTRAAVYNIVTGRGRKH